MSYTKFQQADTRHVNRSTPKTISPVDLEKGGVRLEGVNWYVDSPVQRVYDKEVEKRLMQAITRLRQMLNAGKKCYLFTSETVGGLPVKPTFFTLADAQQGQAESGTLDKLGEYLEKRAGMSVIVAN